MPRTTSASSPWAPSKRNTPTPAAAGVACRPPRGFRFLWNWSRRSETDCLVCRCSPTIRTAQPRLLPPGTPRRTLSSAGARLRPVEDVVEVVHAVYALRHVLGEGAEQLVVPQLGGDVLLLEGGLRGLSGGASGKNQDVGAADVLGRRQLRVDADLTEALVGSELVGHQPQDRVGLEADQTGAQNARHRTGIHQRALVADLFEVLGGVEEVLAAQQPTPPFELAVTDAAQPSHHETPRPHALRHHAQDEVHQLLQAYPTRRRLFPTAPVGDVDVYGHCLEDLAPLVGGDGQQPTLVLREAVAEVEDGGLVSAALAERLHSFHFLPHGGQDVRRRVQFVSGAIFILRTNRFHPFYISTPHTHIFALQEEVGHRGRAESRQRLDVVRVDQEAPALGEDVQR
jgi:hypothetical protein